MIIEQTKDEIIFKISKKIKSEDLQDSTDLFEFKQIAKKSKANQKELDTLLNQSRKGRWNTIKSEVCL